MDLINRLSILDPEDFAEGPESTDIDQDDLVKWLSTPGRAPEFSSLARSSSISINRRSDLNINESRDLIDVSMTSQCITGPRRVSNNASRNH